MSDLLRLYGVTDHKTTDVWGVDNVMSNCHLHQDLNYTIRYVQNMIKYTSIKLYNAGNKFVNYDI